MRIAVVESQYGRPNPLGRIPHRIAVHEEWTSLDDGITHMERLLGGRGVTWQTRRLGPDMAEIDVHDAPTDTLLGLFDADAIETRTGTPIMDYLRFAIEKKSMLETLATEVPGFQERQEALGVREVGKGQSQYRWSSNFADLEGRIKARRVVRGVMPAPGGKAIRVRIWDAVLGFKGDERPVMVWDGEDGPVAAGRIGLGRSGGALQQIPPGMLFISWRKLREIVTEQGKECLVGDPL